VDMNPMLLKPEGESIRRLQVDYRYDMLAGIEERVTGGQADKIL